LTIELDAHGLEQRKATLLALLDRVGEAELNEEDAGAGGRTVRASSVAPLEPPYQVARFEYRELYEPADRRTWRLAEYAYEYLQQPRPGRRAHHWHDPWAHHAHCVDPREPERDDHYRDVPVDVFEAHAEFLRWYALNAQMNCFGLFPLVR